MNEARELLKRVMQDIADMSRNYDISQELWTDIRTYLNQSEIPTGCNQETAKDEAVGWLCCDGGTGYLAFAQGSVKVLSNIKEQVNLPLYLHPAEPERKPMTEEEIFELLKGNGLYCKVSFFCGVQAAEKHHGIGEKDDCSS